MVVIVDYGLGNIRSLLHKLLKAGIEAELSCDPERITAASRLILPGVGHFAAGMKALHERKLVPVLHRNVLENGKPIMGICLGAQLFSSHGDEGDVDGLGWIEGVTRKFQLEDPRLRVPHVGWNTVTLQRSCPFMPALEPNQEFYFTHSYHVCPAREADVVGTTVYGLPFASIICRDNVFGTQFHPEKSHHEGFEIVARFARGA